MWRVWEVLCVQMYEIRMKVKMSDQAMDFRVSLEYHRVEEYFNSQIHQ